MPLCSCGVIPVAASLYNRGASKGATLSLHTLTSAINNSQEEINSETD